MIGLPPTAGFLGKWFILQGAMQSENWIAVIVIVISTVLTAGYFLPILVRAFFRVPNTAAATELHGHGNGEAPWQIVLALAVTAIGSVALFVLPGIPLALSHMIIGVRP
jgi:multicomponent Na+:H+ antiporter subunit D